MAVRLFTTEAIRSGATPASSPAARSEAYCSEAGHYDRRTDAFRQWRQLLIEQLPARRGDTLLDVGTKLCLPLRQDKVGHLPRVVGHAP